MKISYRTHPVLEFLYKKELGTHNIFSCDRQFYDINKTVIENQFKEISLGINHQIYQFSQAFIEAYERAGDKLYDAYLWDQVEDDNICMFLPSGETTLLKIRNNIDKKYINVHFFDFHKNLCWGGNGVAIIDYSKHQERPDTSLAGNLSFNVQNLDKHILNCVIITLFIKFAEVETKLLPAGLKEKGIKCNYKNETKLPIVLLDSKWFTTLVKSDAFKVRGHFRLQPKKKDGVWTKELIWINEFEKSGYTAPARKLAEL